MIRHRSITPEIRAWIEIVVDDNGDDLLRYLRRRTPVAEDAADLLGRVFLLVWETAAKTPTTQETARMWCFGIARNVLREHTRQSVKQLRLADALRTNITARAPESGNDAADAAEAGIEAERVRAALASLDDRSRELIMLIHWDGFSIAQAAALLSMNSSTARSRYSRAKERLASLLVRMAPPGKAQLTPDRGSDSA
jgi:RNA polymerase sigma-70 factor, ECF subfamily